MTVLGIIFNVFKIALVFLVLFILQKLGVFKFINEYTMLVYKNKKRILKTDRRKRAFIKRVNHRIKLNDEI